MTKKSTLSAEMVSPAKTERRASRRCKITQLMRIRPSDPEKQPFEDLRASVTVSRSGIYFHTTEMDYEVGMRLFITMPFSYSPNVVSREYLAEVVRKDALPNGMYGIGFKTLLEMSEQPTYSFGPPEHQK
ncbi:MAG: PilZ domain-containing protein [Acidobacteriota bacterium]|nr:PilZ domain-containing protein [Acidobacteriota bacterium]